MVINFEFRIFIIMVNTIFNIRLWLNISTIYIVPYVLLYLSTISSSLSINTFFCITVICLYILLFKVLINLSATTYLSILFIEYISISLSCNHDFTNLLQNSLPQSTNILFGLQSDLSKIFCNTLLIIIPFFVLQEENPRCKYK